MVNELLPGITESKTVSELIGLPHEPCVVQKNKLPLLGNPTEVKVSVFPVGLPKTPPATTGLKLTPPLVLNIH